MRKYLPVIGIIVISAVVGIVGWNLKSKKQSSTTSGMTQIQTSQTSEKGAIEKVRQLPEVKNYLAKVPNAHVQVSSFDEESGTYSIQVFEVKDNHTATFGWWDVEKISGKVKKSI